MIFEYLHLRHIMVNIKTGRMPSKELLRYLNLQMENNQRSLEHHDLPSLMISIGLSLIKEDNHICTCIE